MIILTINALNGINVVMRTDKKKMSIQREMIEKKLRPWLKLRAEKPPRSGWIKAIRGALGLTTYQLANLMGVNQATALRLEQREAGGKATLESIGKVANAMGCQLVYAIVPQDRFSSLDAIISLRADRLAETILERVEHTMRLEKQGTGFTKTEKKKLVEKLKRDMDVRIWDERKKKK